MIRSLLCIIGSLWFWALIVCLLLAAIPGIDRDNAGVAEVASYLCLGGIVAGAVSLWLMILGEIW